MEILMYVGAYFLIASIILPITHYRAAKSGQSKTLTRGELKLFSFTAFFLWPLILPFMIFGMIYNSTIFVLELIGGKIE